MNRDEARNILCKSKMFNYIDSDVFKHLKIQIDKWNITEENPSIIVPVEVQNNIMTRLKEFEKKQKFLKDNVSLSTLAVVIKTNSKYLSKTINTHKQKTFTNYINDLRIEYLIEKLKINTPYSKHSIQAIAKGIGFKTSRAFSKAFYKKTGQYPSKYIKKRTS